MRMTVTFARTVVLLILLLLWACNFPHYQISNFIGEHFPWPANRLFRWPALLLEGGLIQIAVCVPVALLLVAVFRKSATRVALALALIFVARAYFELPSLIPYGDVFIMYLAACHLLLLTGVAALAGKRLLRTDVKDHVSRH